MVQSTARKKSNYSFNHILSSPDRFLWSGQPAEFFDTSVLNIRTHTFNILKEKEIEANSVIKEYLTTAF